MNTKQHFFISTRIKKILLSHNENNLPNKACHTRQEFVNIGYITYNILTNQIEVEKNIKEGEDIPTLAKQIFIGKYLGENNVTVYIKETRNKLHKLDSNLNLIWSIELELPFYQIIENDEMYFVTYEKKGNMYKLITKNGQKQLLPEMNDIVVGIQKNKMEYSDIIDLRGNFSFDKPNNRIILSKE